MRRRRLNSGMGVPCIRQRPCGEWGALLMEIRTRVKTILVADDDLEIRSYFQTLLRLQGYGVLLAESGEESLRFLAAGQPPVSLAILDVMMPGRNGIETLKEIRRLYGDLPVIL